MTKLYTIAEEYRELVKLADSDDEGMVLAVKDTMDAIGGEFELKAQAVIQVALNMDSDCAALDAEIERLQARKKTITNKANNLREYLRINMEATGITNISCPLFSISIAKGREMVVIDDADKLPDELVKVKTEIQPDKAAILAKLKAGEKVPGASLGRTKSALKIK